MTTYNDALLSEAALDTLLEDTEPLVQMTSRSVARKYKTYMDHEDLAQELRIWIITHDETVRGYIYRDSKQETGRGFKALRVTLTRLAERSARSAKATQTGYAVDDEWFYQRAQVAEVLPTVLAGGEDGYEKAQVDGEIKAPSDPAEGNNRLAMMADVSAAWDAHPDALLQAIYGPGDPRSRQQIADGFDMALSTLQRRERRALDKLVQFLGGENVWVN